MLESATQHDFLNPITIATFGGSTGAILAVTFTIRKVFGVNRPAVPFVLALAFSFALAWSQASLKTVIDWIIAVVNGCLLFCAVAGANETANVAVNPQAAGQGEQQGAEPKRMIRSLFR
ncbi:MAG TPA: hypothetical protein VGQ71_14285 [Terriglobales bacterium]|nr:hypothetical protein [Terriglobales bacterium]